MAIQIRPEQRIGGPIHGELGEEEQGFGAPALADVADDSLEISPAVHGDRAAADLHWEDRAILSLMGRFANVRTPLLQLLHAGMESCDPLGRYEIGEPKAKQFFARIAVGLNGPFVGLHNPQILISQEDNVVRLLYEMLVTGRQGFGERPPGRMPRGSAS